MKKYLIYGHGGCYNHGAEAITKSTIEFLKKNYPSREIILSTHFIEQDIEFGLKPDRFVVRNLNGKNNKEVYKETFDVIDKDTIAIHVGGDNYCYNNWQRYAEIHREVIRQGGRSILWGCSIDKNVIDKEMLKVLGEHTLIMAREANTYNTLSEYGLKNVVKVADIAFTLEPKVIDIDINNYVVINISPLVVKKNAYLIEYIEKLIDYIINNTSYNIVFLPHVNMPMDNDYNLMEKIIDKRNKRMLLMDNNLSVTQYKYIISNAELCIAARTHAAIAAYSTCVPTLALVYSEKGIGIAKDLDMMEYIVDVNDIDEGMLINMFEKMDKYKENIRDNLSKKIELVKNCIMSEVIEGYIN